ncbi:MAG: hypothetical protein HGA87_05965 [Desulfobulbaceae bacterium]|nr:hypothetical protein [Desulfobulbaceae bacterium]
MQQSIADIDSSRFLYLDRLFEPTVNELCIILVEAGAAPITLNLDVGDKSISGHPIEPFPGSRVFEVTWSSYIAYSVRNESFTMGDDGEIFEGKLFVLFSNSHYLDFIKKSTFASTDYPGPFKHWGVFCLDHTIDVVSEDEPIIRLLHVT